MTNAAKNVSIMLNNLLQTLKITSRRLIQKAAEATTDLIGNKVADKITSTALQFNPDTAAEKYEVLIEIPDERYIFPEK